MLAILFRNLSFKNSHFQNVSTSVVTKLLSSILFIVIVPFAIANIGEAKYGIVAFFLTMNGYVSLLDTGFSYAFGLRYAQALATEPDRAPKVVEGSLPIYLFLSFIGFVAIWLNRGYISQLLFGSEVYRDAMVVFGLSLGVTVLDSFFVVIIQAHNNIKWISLNRFGLDVVKIVFLVILILFNYAPEFIVWGLLLGSLIKLALDIHIANRLCPLFQLKIDFSPKEFKQNIRLSWAAIGVAIASLFLSMIDKTLINSKFSSEVFASYSFSFDLTSKSYFLMYAIVGSSYPTLMRRIAKGDSIKDILKLNLLGLSVISFGYYLPLVLFGKSILTIITNPDFAERTAQILPYSTLAAVLYLTFNIFENILNARGHIVSVLVIYLAGVVSLVLAVQILIPRYGVTGAALSLLAMYITMLFVTLVSFRFFKRTDPCAV